MNWFLHLVSDHILNRKMISNLKTFIVFRFLSSYFSLLYGSGVVLSQSWVKSQMLTTNPYKQMTLLEMNRCKNILTFSETKTQWSVYGIRVSPESVAKSVWALNDDNGAVVVVVDDDGYGTLRTQTVAAMMSFGTQSFEAYRSPVVSFPYPMAHKCLRAYILSTGVVGQVVVSGPGIWPQISALRPSLSTRIAGLNRK